MGEWPGTLENLEGMTNEAYWNDRRVLVTGIAGFLGTRLANRLIGAGATVIGLDLSNTGLTHWNRAKRRRFKFVKGDTRNGVVLRMVIIRNEIQTVFHLAAQSIVDKANRNPIEAFETNIRGTWTLLEACSRSPSLEQVVHASSDHVYGECTRAVASENSSFKSLYPYDVSKLCSDLIARSYAATNNFPVAITRCSNLYGEGDFNWSRIIPGTIRSVLRGERPVIKSDGKYVRDYLYVEDAIDGYLTIAQKLAVSRQLMGEAFNLSSENYMSVIGIVQTILKMLNSDLKPIVLNQATNEIRNLRISSRKARQMLGWKPKFTLECGLRRTIDSYREHLNGLK